MVGNTHPCPGHKLLNACPLCDNEFCNDRDPTNDIFACKPEKENGLISCCANDEVCLRGHCSATKDCEALPSLGKPCATNDNGASCGVSINVVDRNTHVLSTWYPLYPTAPITIQL